MNKIFDCFTFFNELDILEIRLNILDAVVDKFVLVEATRTHSNQPKPLYFEDNKERFAMFLHKIEHVIVDDYPEYKTAWTYEAHQRTCISRGLKDCGPDDCVMVSDIDEIPKPELVLEYRNTKEIVYFEQLFFYYFINFINTRRPIWKGGTRIGPGSALSAYSPNDFRENNWKAVKDGGWHFSFLGGIEAIKQKIEAFAHQEYNKAEYTSPENIKKAVERGEDIFKRGYKYKYKTVRLDGNFPEFLLHNRDKYAHLINSVPENKYGDIHRIVTGYNNYVKIREAIKYPLRQLKKVF